MRDRNGRAAEIEAVDEDAGNGAVRDADTVRPFRSRNRRDDRHQADHDRHADGEIGQGIGVVDDVFGADESGAPEHDEQDRRGACGQGFLIMVHCRPHCPTGAYAATRISERAMLRCDGQRRQRSSAAHHSSGQGSMIFQSSTPFLIFFMSVVSPPLRRIQSFTVLG